LGKIAGVATLIPQSDRSAIEAKVLRTTRDLLCELGNSGAVEAVRVSASLDRDLGLGSIERVELLSRLDRAFGVNLPEGAIGDAKTLDDIISALAAAPRKDGGSLVPRSAASPAAEQSPGAIQSRIETRSEATSRELGSASTGEGARLLRWVLETIYGVYAATVFFIWLVLTWLIVLLMPGGAAAARLTSAAIRAYFALAGCRLNMEGREQLGAYGPCIFVSNHTSYSDVLAVMALFDTNYHFVAKSEIEHMPFIGTFLRKLGHFSFDRNKLRARSRQAERMEQALLQGESLFVFAEGTFTAHPGVRPFQLGAFRAAVKTGRPIVPVALRGARRFLRDGTFLPKPSRITVSISPALFPAPEIGGREWAEVLRLRDDTRQAIARHSGEPLL
jgi:1-acyl-sn-glycerol-3-phosphate acyltransferase